MFEAFLLEDLAVEDYGKHGKHGMAREDNLWF